MKKLFLLLTLMMFSFIAFADEIEVRSIEKSELDMRCIFSDVDRVEKKFTLELSRDHKSLRVFYIDSSPSHTQKVFLARLKRYNYNPSTTHVSMSFENPNQRGNILYLALGVPRYISPTDGEQAQHAIIHFKEGQYLNGRCHVLFK